MTALDRAALLLLAVLLLTMPVFAVTRRTRQMDFDVARRPATILLGFWVRDWLMWVIGPLERGFVRARLSPTLFNVLGVVFGAAAGIAFARDALSLAGWLILLGGVADVFDGRIARARGVASPYGAFLDSSLDRFAEAFMFVGLVVRFAGSPWTLAATALALGGSLLVSYTRARGEGLNVDCRGGVMQRAERLVSLALASLLDAAVTSRAGWVPGSLLAAVVVAIALGSVGTAIYRTVAIARELTRRQVSVPR